ncbi:MAG: hypothetical protein RR983_16825, partial [Massilia sp.]
VVFEFKNSTKHAHVHLARRCETGPNGLTVFYIPLHLKPHVDSGAGVPQQWSSYGNECNHGHSPSRLMRGRRPPVH